MINHHAGRPLTPIETIVLNAVANGHSNEQIATDTHRAVSTIKSHVARILAKLGAHNRAHAVRIGYTAGLITPDDIHTPTGARP